MSGSRVYSSALLAPLAEQLVDAMGIVPGMRMLDLLAGDGQLTGRLASRGPVVAVEHSDRAAAALAEELRALRLEADVVAASPAALPFPDDHFDIGVSLLRITAAEGGQPALCEIARVSKRAAVVVYPGAQGTRLEDMLLRSWEDVSGFVPPQLSSLAPPTPPARWTASLLRDVARFDSTDQLWRALFDHHGLLGDGYEMAAIRARFDDRAVAFAGADGTLRIPVDAALLRGPEQ